MNPAVRLALLAALATGAAAPAQDRPAAKPERKTMTFQPGARQPDSGTPAPAPAASTGTPAELNPLGVDGPGQMAAAFFASLQRKQVDEAYAALTKGSKIGDRPEELKTLKAKTNEAIEVFGAIQGYEVIESKPVGTHLLRRTYLTLGTDFPLRWRFYFYYSGNVWRLVDLRVDDRLGGFFDEPEEARGATSAETRP